MKCPHLLACALVLLGTGLFAPPAPARAVVAIGPMPRPQPRPMPPPGWSYIWVAPVYRTVTDRVWVVDRTEMISDWIEVAPGRFEQVWRQVIIPAHWETNTHQILVADGHWELVRVDPPIVYPPVPMPPPVIVRSRGTVGVDGYSSGPGEDLSKFTPLKEWPK